MKIFFDTRSQARTVKSGKLVDLGIESNKRWGRTVQIEHKQKGNTLTLTSCKDWRYPEKAKAVQVKVKKLKEMVK
jgi:hypothetical protein